MKSTAFWLFALVMITWCAERWMAWSMAFIAGDPAYQADCFQRMCVAFGWTLLLFMSGAAYTVSTKKA